MKRFILLTLFILTLATSVLPCNYCPYHDDGKPDTFVEEIIGICQPLFIIAIFVAPPFIIVLVLMGVAKTAKTGAKLVTDVFKDEEDDEEDDEDD